MKKEVSREDLGQGSGWGVYMVLCYFTLSTEQSGLDVRHLLFDTNYILTKIVKINSKWVVKCDSFHFGQAAYFINKIIKANNSACTVNISVYKLTPFITQ